MNSKELYAVYRSMARDELEASLLALCLERDHLRCKLDYTDRANDRLAIRIRNLEIIDEAQVNTICSLRKEIESLKIDRDCIQESLDEFGSDTVEVIEMCLKDRLTEEEMTIYREGMKVINNGREFTEDEIVFLHSHPAIPITRQEVQEIALNVMEEALRDILER